MRALRWIFLLLLLVIPDAVEPLLAAPAPLGASDVADPLDAEDEAVAPRRLRLPRATGPARPCLPASAVALAAARPPASRPPSAPSAPPERLPAAGRSTTASGDEAPPTAEDH